MSGRKFLTAKWRNLALLNFVVDPDLLTPYLPTGLELDFFQGNTFVSVVGFQFLQTRILGVAVPFHRNFEEVNLRFYVRRKTAEGWRRGVVFIKEVVPRLAVAAAARWLYNERYVTCPMSERVLLPNGPGEPMGVAEYSWSSRDRVNLLRAEFACEPSAPGPGSEEEFIT